MAGQLAQFGRGGNDTAAAYGSIVHGRPDPVQLSLSVSNADPLYPKLNVSDPAYQRAYKNLHVFTDSMINNRPMGPASSETDHVWYMQCLNGLYNKNDKPWRLVSRLNIHGTTEDDILATEGPAQNNTVLLTGKSTTTNTGPAPILGGQYYYLDFPSRNPDKMFTGGCSKMGGVPENFLCLWTMPFNENIHRCVPIAMYKFYTDKDITENDSDFGQKINAHRLVDAVLDSAIVALGMLWKRDIIDDAALEAAVNVIKGRPNAAAGDQAINDFKDEFAKRWLQPLSEDGLLKPNAPLPALQSLPPDNIFDGGSAFLPTSLEVESLRAKRNNSGKNYDGAIDMVNLMDIEPSLDETINLAQLTAAEDLCVIVHASNMYFGGRIAGKTETTADPAMEMDQLAARFHGM